jgi:hypothetical protein
VAYICLLDLIVTYCDQFKGQEISILEIGVDRGQTMLPLIHEMILASRDFRYDALDIVRQDTLHTCIQHFVRDPKRQKINFIEMNSLRALPGMVSGQLTRKESPRGRRREPYGPYHVILLDGDHNYATVYHDLEHIVQLSTVLTLIVVDDYNTRWSETDMFYHDRATHEEFDTTSQDELSQLSHSSEKQGVKSAVDDFLKEHLDWVKIDFPWNSGNSNGEADAVCLYNNNSPFAAVLSDPGLPQTVLKNYIAQYDPFNYTVTTYDKPV